MRHIAWLNAIPKEADKPRREIVSAAQQELVDLDEYEQHLIKLWREVGSVSQGSMSVAPLVWTEIIAWANQFYYEDTLKVIDGYPLLSRICVLEDYELEIIMQLSREYCNEYAESSDPQRPCPREIFLDEIDAEANADAILEGFKSLWGSVQDTKPEVVPNSF